MTDDQRGRRQMKRVTTKESRKKLKQHVQELHEKRKCKSDIGNYLRNGEEYGHILYLTVTDFGSLWVYGRALERMSSKYSVFMWEERL